ncbi:Uncharacterized protein PBTT_07832 [Plasmodiophora brassicae]|uniref:Uncharacterized protein n=1 Tax=Plasmodiophora brassicae TaxID=37360 RepID=A0A0G4J4D6_PLABS|nr:hypothetical protein PBRA_008961 [Plasmodiophora brassicae]
MSLPLHHDVEKQLSEHYFQCIGEERAREQAYMDALMADPNDPRLPALLQHYKRAEASSAKALAAWQTYRQTAPAEGGLVTVLNRILATIVPNRSTAANHGRRDRDRGANWEAYPIKKTN